MAQPPKGAASLSKNVEKGESTINPKTLRHHRNTVDVTFPQKTWKPKNAGIDGATPKKATHPIINC